MRVAMYSLDALPHNTQLEASGHKKVEALVEITAWYTGDMTYVLVRTTLGTLLQ
jgi:hypothetical protein